MADKVPIAFYEGVLQEIEDTDTATVANLKTGTLIVSTHTPSSASDTGTAGTICWDSSYLYVCIATNTWKRAPLATW